MAYFIKSPIQELPLAHLLKIGYLLIFLSLGCLWNTAAAAPSKNSPTQVHVGLHIYDISAIDEKNQTVTFEGKMIVHWAATKPIRASMLGIYRGAKATQTLNSLWHPDLTLYNARGPIYVTHKSLKLSPDQTITYTQRIKGAFGSAFNFRQFPFDTQTLSFHIEPFTGTAQKIRLIVTPESQHVAMSNLKDEWDLISLSGSVANHTHPDGQVFSQYQLQLKIKRQPEHQIYQSLLPLIVIVLLSFSVLWMADQPVVNRIGVSISCILTITVFQWRLFTHRPHVSYHIYLDALILLAFVSTASTALITLLATRIGTNKMLHICRWLYPLLFCLASMLITVFFFT